MTKLAVAIFAENLGQALAQAAVAAERGADMVEFRLDTFAEPPARAAELVRRSPLPCIVTCRPTWEGGEFKEDEESRLRLVFAAAASNPAYIDLELQTLDRTKKAPAGSPSPADKPGDEALTDASAFMSISDLLPEIKDSPFSLHGSSRVILSSHDFESRPPDLLRRVQTMAQDERCAVIKLAWRARSLRDNLEAFELLRSRVKPMIALCMGEFGLPSRVLAKKFGALLTFAGLDEATVTAPGQPGVQTLKGLYRWDSINKDTLVYGVIGWPVGHSLSPHVHNAGFGAVGHNGVYLPMPIPPEYEHFKATVGAWIDDRHMGFRGASVTIPHKQNLLRFVEERGGEIEPLARRIGAANTLTVRPEGTLLASNTDCAAALEAIGHALGIHRDQLAGVRVGVIGAGGGARAVVAGLAGCGATVVVYNRTLEKAKELAEQFNGPAGKVVWADLNEIHKSCCQVIVNCAPIGMHPDIDASPITHWPDRLGRGSVVFDTIYNPLETRLLREARAHGCTTICGIEMFIRQAAAQFTPWTEKPAPIDLFRKTALERLKGTAP